MPQFAGLQGEDSGGLSHSRSAVWYRFYCEGRNKHLKGQGGVWEPGPASCMAGVFPGAFRGIV